MIPAAKKLTVNQLTGAAENSVAGARVDLFHRVGPTDQRIAAPLFLNGATQQIALKKTYWEAYQQWPREIDLGA